MGSVQRDREREEELKLYLEWKTAKIKRRRDAALLKLCQRSDPALRAALKRLANKYGERHKEDVTPETWLEGHGLTKDDASKLSVLGVMEAGEQLARAVSVVVAGGPEQSLQTSSRTCAA